MTLSHLKDLKVAYEGKVKYRPVIKKIDRTEKKVYNYGQPKNKETIYCSEETSEAIKQIEDTFKNYIEYRAGANYNAMVVWCDLGVICKDSPAKWYVNGVQEHYTEIDDDELYTHDDKLKKSTIYNKHLRDFIFEDMIAIRIYDATIHSISDPETCEYGSDWADTEYTSKIYCVRFADFFNCLKAYGYKVLSNGKPIESFDDYYDAFIDFDNVNGFRIIADFSKKQDKVLTKQLKNKKTECED